jgi:hypothetical protein
MNVSSLAGDIEVYETWMSALEFGAISTAGGEQMKRGDVDVIVNESVAPPVFTRRRMAVILCPTYRAIRVGCDIVSHWHACLILLPVSVHVWVEVARLSTVNVAIPL